MPGEVREIQPRRCLLVHELQARGSQLEERIDDRVPVRLTAAGKVEETAVLTHRVVPELGIPIVRVECVYPALSGEVSLEIDGPH